MTGFAAIRWLATALGMLCLVGLSGCGRGGGSSPDKVTLTITTAGPESLRPIFLNIFDEFETEHPRIEVKMLKIAGTYYQKLLVMIAGRTAPDLMWMGQSFAEFAIHGAFLDLSDRIAKEIDTSEYHPKVLGWYRFGDTQYGIPFGIDMEFIVYNKAHFDEAGVAYPKDGWTIDQFVETAKKLTVDRNGDGRIDQYGYWGRINEAAFGGQFVSDDGLRATCDTKEMVEGLQFNLDLVHKWKVAPAPEEERQQSQERYYIFRQGKAAMMQFYTWNMLYLRDRLAGMDWDIVGMPTARRRAHWASSAAYLISANTRYPDEAWLLFKKIISDKVQLALAAESLPANLRLARQLIAENTQRPDNLKALLEATDYLYPSPRVPNLQELLHHYQDAREKVFTFYGTDRYVPPEQAMAEAARRINKTIKRRRGR